MKLMSKFTFAIVISLSCLIVNAAKVENFALLDQNGESHELYYYSDAEAVVLIVQGNGCPIIRNALPDIKQVREQVSEDVVFLMLNANLQDTRSTIAEEASEWEIDFPILVDETQLIARSLDITRTAEVFVFNPRTWEIAYRGPVNDRLGYERQKAEAEEHYLLDAIAAVSADELPTNTGEGAKGCLINIEAPQTEISYVDDIAPILASQCMTCHIPDGIGSWSMSSYDMIKGFSPMMREVIRTNRMPPWHADPHIGEWQNDRALSNEQRKTLIDWIEAGSPRGQGEDPLPALMASLEVEESVDWPLGQPDLIVDVPPYDVPATGVVDYQNYDIASDLTEGVWVKGITVKPGDKNVVHHLLVGTLDPGRASSRGVFDNYLGGYAPGVAYAGLPEDSGVYIAPGSKFAVQMHYTPYGKAARDETQIGVYFHDAPPTHFVRHGVVIDYNLQIPANTKAHEESSYLQFDKDALLYTVLPHSHYRGRSSTFEIEYPDGEREMLLSVPNYDFNWQTGYAFTEPFEVPAGSKLIHRTIYDNSKQNFANPDPNATVTWGLQSWEEMLYGDFAFRWKDETTSNPIHDATKFRSAQMLGALDTDMDGGLEREELRGRTARQFEPAYQHFDANQNEALELEEFYAYQQFAAKRRNEERAKRQAAAAGTEPQEVTEGQ